MTWALDGAATTYSVRLFSDSALMLDYWGPRGGATPWPDAMTTHSFAAAADLAPLEYASAGTRHVHRSELLIEHDDSLAGALWRYQDDDCDGQRLAVRFVDDTGRLELTQHIVMHAEFDVVEKWVTIRNLSADHHVYLTRTLSAAWSVLAPDGARLHYLAGAWGREFDRESVELRYGTLQIGSRQGITGHLFAPVMQVEAVGRPGAYGIALAWSGSWTMVGEGHPGGLVRVSTGIDDGWFKGRATDSAGLGDWTADPESFPDGLAPLADGITSLGMRFGLWIEPEAVNPDSELHRAHPNWVYRSTTREPVLLRNQLVLNLGMPEVRSHLAGVLRALLTVLPVTYLKWDMNRPISDPGLPSSEWAVAHVEGYYSLKRLLRDEFPHVTVEACAGGGGRIDFAILGLADVVWTSDETGPRDRLIIQDGFLRAFPAHVMSSWVTDLPGTRDRAATTDAVRFVTAMAGVLGIGADVTRWTSEQYTLATSAIALYKELRPVLHAGDVHFHGDPSARLYALEYATEDRVVLLIWDTSRERTGDDPLDTRLTPQPRIQLSGVDAARSYRARHDGSVHSGAALQNIGLTVPWAFAVDCDVLILDVVS